VGRYDTRDRILAMDPVRDSHAVYRLMATREFPWDVTQALSFALFRTYAVPSIGRLLARTAELTERTQRRYDDTVLLLDAVLEHGLASAPGRTAVRRINQMHRRYDISDDDMRYVLCTFVVVPIRWIDRYGWRRLTEHERIASAEYYAALGRHMGIPGVPRTWQSSAHHLDAYERAQFGFDPAGRAVADATLDLFATFPANRLLPARAVRQVSYSLMDDRLLDAFGFPRPHPAVRALVQGGLRARGRAERLLPPRREPSFARSLRQLRSHPDGYDLAALGTFPAGCPVPTAHG
jgi:hypothetical protein